MNAPFSLPRKPFHLVNEPCEQPREPFEPVKHVAGSAKSNAHALKCCVHAFKSSAHALDMLQPCPRNAAAMLYKAAAMPPKGSSHALHKQRPCPKRQRPCLVRLHPCLVRLHPCLATAPSRNVALRPSPTGASSASGALSDAPQVLARARGMTDAAQGRNRAALQFNILQFNIQHSASSCPSARVPYNSGSPKCPASATYPSARS